MVCKLIFLRALLCNRAIRGKKQTRRVCIFGSLAFISFSFGVLQGGRSWRVLNYEKSPTSDKWLTRLASPSGFKCPFTLFWQRLTLTSGWMDNLSLLLTDIYTIFTTEEKTGEIWIWVLIPATFCMFKLWSNRKIALITYIGHCFSNIVFYLIWI